MENVYGKNVKLAIVKLAGFRVTVSESCWSATVILHPLAAHINYVHTHTALWILSTTTHPGELVPEETFTHSHLPWLSIVPYLLHPSNRIHGILPVQSMCLAVFLHNLFKFSLVYLLAWHPPLHTPFSSSSHCLLFQHMPIPSQPVLL